MSLPAPAKKKALKVNVLRCRDEACRALMAYEETSEGFLLGNMIELAVSDGQRHWLPCPRCGGRNLVEEVPFEGKLRTRVTGFEPAA
jgi:hypothetical protein